MGAGKIMHLWNHNTDMFAGPPVAVVKALREVPRDELPEAVLKVAPNATGGAEVIREYLDTPRGNEVLAAIKAGAVTEMSYAYDAIKFDFVTKEDGRQIRNLYEEKLFETSDVLWGANEATLASKGLRPSLDILLKQLIAYMAELKAGARHSAKDIENLNAIHSMVVDLGATKCLGIADEEMADEPTEDNEKSRAAIALTLKRAEEFLHDTRLADFLATR